MPASILEGGLVGTLEAGSVRCAGQGVDEHVEHGAGGRGEVAAADHRRLDRPELVELAAEGVAIDVVHPRRVDRRPADLTRAERVGVEICGVLGHRREQRAEAVGTEEGAGRGRRRSRW